LLIIRYPLPAIIASLVLDSVDQTIFQSMGYDPPGYQGYDKAMDVYYLAVAYLSTLRNWTSASAFAVGRFLYFYRLVGVVAFELSDWRPMLLIFPNTFEYFFIAYEALRLRWNPDRLGLRTWVLIAGGIWVFVKLPQEWWIHVAQLDLTDEIAAHAWLLPAIVVGVVVISLVAWRVLPARLGPADWPLRTTSDPVPESIDERSELAAWVSAHARVWSAARRRRWSWSGSSASSTPRCCRTSGRARCSCSPACPSSSSSTPHWSSWWRAPGAAPGPSPPPSGSASS
jgi:hypothetical protein